MKGSEDPGALLLGFDDCVFNVFIESSSAAHQHTQVPDSTFLVDDRACVRLVADVLVEILVIAIS